MFFLLKLTTTWSIFGTKAMEKCQQWCFALAIAADDVMFGDLVPGVEVKARDLGD